MRKSDYEIYSSSKEAWDAMYKAISVAKKSVYWEVYVLVDDEAGNKFFDVLMEKAKLGVDVKLVIDYWGSFALSRKKILELRKAGVEVKLFQLKGHPFKSFRKWIGLRTHRKILLIDEKVGFVGGVNVQKSMKDWWDIHVRMEGKVVHSLLRAFAKSYILSGGEKGKVKHLLKYKYRHKENLSEMIYDEPSKKISRARKKYTEALLKARERVILFSPYYFPDKKFLYALWKARKRGVKVDLLIPYRSDVKIAKYVMFTWFSLLKKHGVNVHLADKMMHGKGVIMDDEWAMVGSSNIDQSGFYDTYEANLQIKDKKAVKKIKSTLQKWIKSSKHFKNVEWEKRGKFHKAKEWLALKLYKFWYGER
jgi:cardiolipin synthase A/B